MCTAVKWCVMRFFFVCVSCVSGSVSILGALYVVCWRLIGHWCDKFPKYCSEMVQDKMDRRSRGSLSLSLLLSCMSRASRKQVHVIHSPKLVFHFLSCVCLCLCWCVLVQPIRPHDSALSSCFFSVSVVLLRLQTSARTLCNSMKYTMLLGK